MKVPPSLPHPAGSSSISDATQTGKNGLILSYKLVTLKASAEEESRIIKDFDVQSCDEYFGAEPDTVSP